MTDFELFNARYSYDPGTGVFTSRRTGKIAGYRRQAGYVLLRKNGKAAPVYAHRVAWLLTHGEWPPAHIDHINGVRDDNRIANLRLATRQENAHNTALPRVTNRTSRVMGVHRHSQNGNWIAQITVAGKCRHLGSFSTIEAAAAAYRKAKDELHPTHMRLRDVQP